MASTTATASLTNAQTTGAGSTVDFTTAVSNVSAVIVPNGTVDDGAVAIEASHNSTDWVNVFSVLPRTGVNRSYDARGGAYRYWRASVLTDIAGGGSVTVTFMEAG